MHQLRGRVGRGADQSYCILLTGPQLSRDTFERMNIMVQTNDGFLIAEKDLEIRGPGDIQGTRQSGALAFKLANIVEDKAMLEISREEVLKILDTDAKLELQENKPVAQFLASQKSKRGWGKESILLNL